MRRSSWTPSIVPESGDQNIYLVMDDLGRLGRIWPEADAETTDLETVISDYSPVSTAARFACSHSILPNAGLKTSLPMSRKNFVADAICRCANYHPPFLISWNATKCLIVVN
jgi:hypothetical protein